MTALDVEVFERFMTPIFWVMVVTMIGVLYLMYLSQYIDIKKCSTFTGGSDINRYVIGSEGQSLYDRQQLAESKARANPNPASQMTGSRDIPVFFQDYDYELNRTATGMSNAREGLANKDPAQAEIENRFK